MAVSIDDRFFSPNLEPMPPRQLNWIGHLVHWVRSAENYSLIYKATITVIAIFASIALIFSVIGIPFFILCFKEFIQQRERRVYDLHVQKLMKQATENNRHFYQIALLAPISDSSKIDFSLKMRQDLIRKLNIPEDEACLMSNIELLKGVAYQHPNWIKENGFIVKSPE